MVLALQVAVVWGHAVGEDVWIATPCHLPIGARDDHHGEVAAGHMPDAVRRLASDPDGWSQRQH